MKTAEKALTENNGSAWNPAAELEVIHRRALVGLGRQVREILDQIKGEKTTR